MPACKAQIRIFYTIAKRGGGEVQAGGVIYMATKRYNNEGSSKTEIVGQEMRNA